MPDRCKERGTYMKKTQAMVSLLLAIVLLLTCSIMPALADQELKVKVKAEFRYKEARKMLDLINSFRTGNDAWYWAEDNKTVVRASGLGKLTYDYNLERVAMQRALELAAYFGHTRPDGSSWSTAFPSGYGTKGENLAYGYGSADSAFKGLAEEDKDYAGQGHRRNMLRKEFTRIGIGAVKVGSVIYWAQSFGGGSGSSGSDSNRFKSDKITASMDLLVSNSKSIGSDLESLSVAKGESETLPKVVIYSKSGAKLYVTDCSWESANKKIAKVKNNKVKGVKKGETTLEAKFGGKTITLPIKVTAKATSAQISEIIEDYDPPLAGEFLIVLEEDECFEIE